MQFHKRSVIASAIVPAMGWMILAVVVPLVVLGLGCTKKEQQPIVILGVPASVDYLRSACKTNAQLGSPCLGSPEVFLGNFESQLRTAFATENVCRGVELVSDRLDIRDKLATAAERKPHWFMIVGIGNPARMQGEWSIQYHEGEHNPPSKFFKEYFDNNPRLVALDVCKLVKGAGGSVQN